MKKTVAILLVTALLLGSLAGCTSGNQAKTPVTQKSETFTVEDGQTALASEDGAAIDFGCLLEAGEELTIQKVSPASIDSDVEIDAYDFKLSSGQPEGVVELTIPYDDAGLEADEEILSVCGKYLNEETKQWEDVLYTVDAEANKVHILTDHLSTYSVFKVTNAGKRSEYISEFIRYATSDKSKICFKGFFQKIVSTVDVDDFFSLSHDGTYSCWSEKSAQASTACPDALC
jgi:hypothetical protein